MPRLWLPSSRSRRAFIVEASTTALLAAGLPRDLVGRVVHRAPTGGPLRVRGRVTGGAKALARVAVTDGRTVVTTDAAGRFELLTTSDRRWVSVSIPSGYRLPVQQNGTVRHFAPLAADARGEQTVDFALEPLAGGDERHAFLLCCDPQTQNAFEMERLHRETVPDIVKTRQALGDVALFGVGCGDLMFDDLSLYPEYERAIRTTGVPFFSVVGNHDLDQSERTDEASTTTFERHFGPAWYSFNRGRVHYVVMDDVFWYGDGYLGYLAAEQLAWLQQDLALVERGATVIAFIHIPAASTAAARTNDAASAKVDMVNNRAALYRLLEPFKAHILSGHTHENEHVFASHVHEHVGGTVCGAWWSGDICHDGTPNGYSVYEIAGDEVKWRYQATGLAADLQMRVYPAGSDPSAPGDLVANIWDWDPEWTVTWYEGADRRGLMSQRRSFDPLSVQLHKGPDKPARRTWVEPMPTDHLFFAATAGAKNVRIEARDRFGRLRSAGLVS